MKRKLRLHRETVRHLATNDLTGAQGGAGIGSIVTGNPQSCVYVCQVPTNAFSCGGTCVISHCVRECPVAGTTLSL